MILPMLPCKWHQHRPSCWGDDFSGLAETFTRGQRLSPIAAADPSSKSWRASKQQALLLFWQHASCLLNLQTPLPSCGHATTQFLTPRQGCLTEDHPWCGVRSQCLPYRNPTPALGRLKIPWGSPERIIDPNKIGYSSPPCPQ